MADRQRSLGYSPTRFGHSSYRPETHSGVSSAAPRPPPDRPVPTRLWARTRFGQPRIWLGEWRAVVAGRQRGGGQSRGRPARPHRPARTALSGTNASCIRSNSSGLARPSRRRTHNAVATTLERAPRQRILDPPRMQLTRARQAHRVARHRRASARSLDPNQRCFRVAVQEPRANFRRLRLPELSRFASRPICSRGQVNPGARRKTAGPHEFRPHNSRRRKWYCQWSASVSARSPTAPSRTTRHAIRRRLRSRRRSTTVDGVPGSEPASITRSICRPEFQWDLVERARIGTARQRGWHSIGEWPGRPLPTKEPSAPDLEVRTSPPQASANLPAGSVTSTATAWAMAPSACSSPGTAASARFKEKNIPAEGLSRLRRLSSTGARTANRSSVPTRARTRCRLQEDDAPHRARSVRTPRGRSPTADDDAFVSREIVPDLDRGKAAPATSEATASGQPWTSSASSRMSATIGNRAVDRIHSVGAPNSASPGSVHRSISGGNA